MKYVFYAIGTFGAIALFSQDLIGILDYMVFAMQSFVGAVQKDFPEYANIIPPLIAIAFSIFFVTFAYTSKG